MIWLVLLFALLLVPTNGRGLPPYLFIAVLAVLFFLKKSNISQLKLEKKNRFLLYYAVVYVSSLFLHFYSGSIKVAASFCAYFILSPFIVNGIVKTKREFNRVISFIVAAFTVYSVFGIIECLTAFNIFDVIFGRSGDALWGAVGMTRYGFYLSYGSLRIMHNNATLMCMIWAIAAYQLCNARKRRPFWTLCWVVIGAYDIMMMSRMIIFTAPILQLIIFRKRGSKWLTKRVFIIAVVVLLIVFVSGTDVLSTVWNTMGGLFAPIIDEFFGTSLKARFGSSLGGSGERFDLWGWIFDAVKGNLLFGKGFTDTWSTTISGQNYLGQTWYRTKTSIEVQWLNRLYRTGLYGLSGFIVFQIGSIKRTWKEKVRCFENKVTFQFVMKWLTVFYFFHLFGIAAAEELNIYYFLLAIYMCYVNICKKEAQTAIVYQPESYRDMHSMKQEKKHHGKKNGLRRLKL